MYSWSMNIFILEDHQDMARALTQVLEVLCPSIPKISIFPTLTDLMASGARGDILIADLNLPDSEPIQTSRFLATICDSMYVVCHSGYDEIGEQLAASTNNKVEFIKKGIGRARLIEVISTLKPYHG